MKYPASLNARQAVLYVREVHGLSYKPATFRKLILSEEIEGGLGYPMVIDRLSLDSYIEKRRRAVRERDTPIFDKGEICNF